MPFVIVQNAERYMHGDTCTVDGVRKYVCQCPAANGRVHAVSRRVLRRHEKAYAEFVNAVGDDGAEYTPQLLNILKTSDDPSRRTAATYALTGFSHGNAEAIDLIIPDLDSSDMNVTLFAMRLIIKTGPQAKQAAPKLIELYNDGLPSQRGYAAWSLAAIAPVEGFDTAEAADKMLNRFTVSERERGQPRSCGSDSPSEHA